MLKKKTRSKRFENRKKKLPQKIIFISYGSASRGIKTNDPMTKRVETTRVSTFLVEKKYILVGIIYVPTLIVIIML